MPDTTAPGASDIDLNSIFSSFGYTPSQAELTALQAAFGGANNATTKGAGVSAIANYVLAMQELGPAQQAIQGNLLSEQQAEQMSTSLGQILETQGQASYQAAANIFTQAPQLFGSMTSDQITQYLAPVTQAAQQQLGAVTGQMAARGLGGSSVEANAMAQAQAQYQKNVLSQGLSVGMTQQQQQAAILQALGGQQYSAGQQQYGLGATYAGLANSSAGQNAALATEIAGLPSQMSNNALAQDATNAALNPSKGSGLGADLGMGLGAIGGIVGGIYGGPVGAAAGFSAGEGLGSGIGSAISPNQNPSSLSAANSLGGTASNAALIAALLGGGMGNTNTSTNNLLNSDLGNYGNASGAFGGMNGTGGGMGMNNPNLNLTSPTSGLGGY